MSSPYKLHINKWAKAPKLSFAAVKLAEMIAASADRTYQMIKWLREGHIDALLPGRPPADQWLGLYGDHRRVTQAVFDCFPEFFGKGKQVQATLDDSRAHSTWARNKPDELKAAADRIPRPLFVKYLFQCQQQAIRDYKKHLEEMREDLIHPDRNNDTDVKQVDRAFHNSPEFLFYFRVVLPCVMIHRTFPASLLRKARADRPGQEAAIEKLVRIDDMAVHDPAIQRWRDGEVGIVRSERKKILNAWEDGGLDDGRFSALQVKQSLGGLIWALCESCGDHWTWYHKGMQKAEITAEQIRELFHAVARDRAGRKLGVYDEDIVNIQLESWRRAISNHKKLWRLVLNAGGGFKSARV